MSHYEVSIEPLVGRSFRVIARFPDVKVAKAEAEAVFADHKAKTIGIVKVDRKRKQAK